MIISRTPFRISFFGGGTDFPAWYHKHGGGVLATTIDKYCYLSCRYLPPFFENKHRIVWSRVEMCKKTEEIQHPAVKALIQYLNIDRGLDIHHVGDLPARSGMGSSSAFTVGLLHALYGLQGKMASKHQLATESIRLEQEVLKESVGSQDQVSAAYGGFNRINFLPNGEISVVPVTLTRDRISTFNSHLMLFYTGIVRTSSDVAGTFSNDLEAKRRQLRVMKDLMEEAISILNGSGDIDGFGDLMHEAWEAKRILSQKVSNSYIDEMYATARRAGATGGKITGAGGGGFMLLFVPPERQQAVREALRNHLYVPFKFEFSGSQIIFSDTEVDYTEIEKERERSIITPFRELDVEVSAEKTKAPSSQILSNPAPARSYDLPESAFDLIKSS